MAHIKDSGLSLVMPPPCLPIGQWFSWVCRKACLMERFFFLVGSFGCLIYLGPHPLVLISLNGLALFVLLLVSMFCAFGPKPCYIQAAYETSVGSVTPIRVPVVFYFYQCGVLSPARLRAFSCFDIFLLTQ